jgi:large subunit ribosomal protein L18e
MIKMKTNIQLKSLVTELRKLSNQENKKLWAKVAEEFQKPTRNSRSINLNKINHLTKENDIVIVPGKVLGNGELQHKITIAAFKISSQAHEKLKESKSEFYFLDDFIKNNPKVKNVRILV